MTAARLGWLRCARALLCGALLLSACGGAARPTVTPAPPPSDPVVHLRHDIDTLLAHPDLARVSWGVVVGRDSGEAVYELNPRKLLLPASAMKVVTLAAVADRLGWDYSFQTTVVALGTIEDGVLHGDLLIVGGGDPSLDDWDGAATRLFQRWSDHLKAHGIRTITGRIIGDDNDLDDEGLGPGWAWDDLSASYAAGVGALQFNQNSARVLLTPGMAAEDPAQAQIVPEGTGLHLRHAVVTGPVGSAPAIQTRRLPGSSILDVRGTVPAGAPPIYRNVSVNNPTDYFVTALRNGLLANGVEVRGEAVDIDAVAHPPIRAKGIALIAHRSAPLSELAAVMMKNSQNLYAETLLRTVGVEAARTVLDQWGVSRSDLLLTDGSGLSRYNLVTAEALVSILRHVARDDRLRIPFEETLPLAGVEGTLAQRMNGTAADGNARAKTGSFSNARALAGYVRTADGERLAFAILANNFGVPPDTIEAAADAIVVKLAGLSRR